jgi:hypothetical protein
MAARCTYGFGELDEPGVRLRYHDPQEPRLGTPGCGNSADDAALPDVAAKSGLYGSDAREAPCRPGRAAEGARYRGQGKPSDDTVVKAAGVADRQRYASTKRVGG